MSKVFRVYESKPRSLFPYERIQLEEISVDAMEAEGYDPAVIRERVLAEARHEAERKVQEAYAEGVRRGMEAGRAQFLQSVGQSAAALEASARAIRTARAEFLDAMGPQMIELAGAIARRILQREVETDPDFARRTVHRAIEHLMDRNNVVVHVNPGDAEALRAQKIALLEEFDGVRQITVMPDPEIGPGGCVVETELVHVDARIDAQLERILDALREGPEPPSSEESVDKT